MRQLRKLGLYFHTLRYLKLTQLWGRVVFRLERPSIDMTLAPEVRTLDGLWYKPAQRRQFMFGPESFCLLNECRSLAGAESWNDSGCSKLWLYNLHYFEDLNAEGAPERVVWHRALMARWLAENLPGAGNGWEPYPTSLRIINWVKWALAGNVLDEEVCHSLAIQARWLMKRLEVHLLGNHLFVNAKALIFVGCYFSGPEALSWLRKGMEILTLQVPEQILSDGGQFERSPMYHALAVEDMLDLLNLQKAYPETLARFDEQMGSWPPVVRRMLVALQAMCHPDGEIALFNDSAIGIAPSPASLLDYAERLGLPLDDLQRPVQQLEETGYLRVSLGSAVMLADVAPIGPDYLPGHAHADTLSFELSLFGQRIIVNGGTSQYGCSTERLQERGTAAHSTVEVGGENSSEVWSGFRVARRAYPIGLNVIESDDSITVSCGHDGYNRLPGRAVHWREWQIAEKRLVVCDRVDGVFKSAVARFHLHPDVQPVLISDGKWGLDLPDGTAIAQIKIRQGVARVEPSFYAPEFGKRLGSQCLAIQLDTVGESAIEITWETSH